MEKYLVERNEAIEELEDFKSTCMHMVYAVNDLDEDDEEYIKAAEEAENMESKVSRMYSEACSLDLEDDREDWGYVDYGFRKEWCGPSYDMGWNYLSYAIRKQCCLYESKSIEDLCDRNKTTIDIITGRIGKYL